MCVRTLTNTKQRTRGDRRLKGGREGDSRGKGAFDRLDLCVCEVRRQSPTRTPDTFGAHAINCACSLLQLQLTRQAVREATCVMNGMQAAQAQLPRDAERE